MRLLLDTNILSEARKGRRANVGVREFLAGADDADLATSVLVLGEIRRGIERLRPRDPVAARALDTWLAAIARGYASRTLPVDVAVAEEWGRLSAASTLATVDGLLAATALVHDLTLVTRNVRHFRGTPARVQDPFRA